MTNQFDIKIFFKEQEPTLYTFAQKNLGNGFVIKPLAQDWASRRYFRVQNGDKSYVLMQSVPDHIPVVTMGHKLSSFIRVAKLLKDRGIHAPEIIAMDEHTGFVLLEDFGDVTLGKALSQGADERALYTKATDILIEMRDNISVDDLCDFSKYKNSYIYKSRQRIVDWYIPSTRLAKNNDDILKSYNAAWEDVAAALPPPPIGFIHGDFHLQNVMVLANGDLGVLDFQDAMVGPAPYDLGNLLENIRTDVNPDIYAAMMARYGGDDVCRAWFRVMATQFHCRILGQVFRLAILSNKTDLMDYIPRIQNYIQNALKDPVLKPLSDWFGYEKVDLTAKDFDVEKIKGFIRDDAF